ncbi:MAG: ATP-binding protein [bacterium]|nr:ATP-binding protein [bacterium]
MPLSNSQYDAIMRTYDQKQFQDKREQDERVREVYEHIPRIRELDQQIGSTAVQQARLLLGGDKEALSKLRLALEELRREKRQLLEEGAYPADYMEMHYQCPDCKDSGYRDGKKCHCFLQAQMELLYAQSNIREILKTENFRQFTYRYYDDSKIVERLGMTQRVYMQRVVEQCKEYIRRFPSEKGSILFTGTTGTGKTFLSNCIAAELIERCFSVLYFSATDLFDVFSKNRFESKNPEDMQEMYRHILDCDLLVIDDIGTELINTFTTSQLFYCINERLNRKKGTIVTTNLPLNRLRDEFTDRIASRIMSKYQMIPLVGEDIRIQKKFKKHL